MNILIGIDPGASGATVIKKGELIIFEHQKYSSKELTDNFRIEIFGWPRTVYIEQVSARPHDGVASAFKFGRAFQFVIDLAQFNCCTPIFVLPSTWQREFNLGGTYISRTARKNAHKVVAQKLFPSIKITHANADALLITEYGRRDQLNILKTQTKPKKKIPDMFTGEE